ncbi:hypothetical protein [Streptomyces sp. NPDC005438]|uniref:hypothetical protein n=1 Tax=Streptomyces sp. NPDC005438 TaxID=3156880 RepID=UPI0033AE0F5F
MTTSHDIQWERAEDRRWAATFETELVLRHEAPAGLAAQVLGEVRQLVHEAGEPSLDELLGDPRVYADEVAAERIDEAHTSSVDLSGVRPGERFSTLAVASAVTGLTLVIIHWVSRGFWVEVSPALGTLAFLYILAALAACTAAGLRNAGRFRPMWAWGGLSLAAGIGGIASANGLSQAALFRLPAPLLLLGPALVLGVIALITNSRLDRWLQGPEEERDNSRWVRRLDGLLRGRHGLPAAEARTHTSEVRSHLASSGGNAQETYGDVALYAARLARGARLARRKARREAIALALLVALVGFANEDVLRSADLTSCHFWFVSLFILLGLGVIVRLVKKRLDA